MSLLNCTQVFKSVKITFNSDGVLQHSWHPPQLHTVCESDERSVLSHPGADGNTGKPHQDGPLRDRRTAALRCGWDPLEMMRWREFC